LILRMDNLFAGIWPSPDEKNQSTAKLSRAGLFRWVESGSLPGWQLCRGISGSFRVEWVAGFVWNQWQPWSGIRIQADETRIQVLKEDGKRAQSDKWMWV